MHREGVLFSSLGLFGLISNIASIVTLLSPDMRRQTFNQLLAVLAAYDILWVNLKVLPWSAINIPEISLKNLIFNFANVIKLLRKMIAVNISGLTEEQYCSSPTTQCALYLIINYNFRSFLFPVPHNLSSYDLHCAGILSSMSLYMPTQPSLWWTIGSQCPRSWLG